MQMEQEAAALTLRLQQIAQHTPEAAAASPEAAEEEEVVRLGEMMGWEDGGESAGSTESVHGARLSPLSRRTH
jgi:hypothetical protein